MRENPYLRGKYKSLFAFWLEAKGGIASREEMVQYGESLGMTSSEATSSVNVILSPREASGRGDCRGNISAQGHLYFAQPMAKIEGEDRKFRLEWRSSPLVKRTREKVSPNSGVSVDSVEVETVS